MFQFGPKEVDEDIIEQVLRLKAQVEGGDGQLAIKMRLCQKEIEIVFAEKHLIDLQEMIKKSRELEYGKVQGIHKARRGRHEEPASRLEEFRRS